MQSSFPGVTPLSLITESIDVLNVDSSGHTRLVRPLDVVGSLTWAPQGDKIAYFDYGSRSLYTIGSIDSNQPDLLQKDVYASRVAWSPDGAEIAYSDGDNIYILDLATKHSISLLDNSVKGVEPDWSPNGTQIVFTLNPDVNEPLRSIAIINRDGTSLTQLTPDDGSGSPKWSSDGSKIVFERGRNIYVMETTGTNLTPLIEDGKSYMPDWSLDGKRILFLSNANQKCSGSFLDAPQFCTNEIRIMDADGSNVVTVRNIGNKRYMYPTWSPRN